jgi:hypothetical protein
MALTAVSRGLAQHRMLAVALAAVLCHSDIARAFLETSKASPGQQREEGQNCYPRYSQAMSFVSRHGAPPTFLRSPNSRVNPTSGRAAMGMHFCLKVTDCECHLSLVGYMQSPRLPVLNRAPGGHRER